MGWLWSERRNPTWKENTLASISFPPFPLLSIFIIIFLLMYLSSYFNYKHHTQPSVINFQLVILFLPVVLIIVSQLVSKCEWSTKGGVGVDRGRWELPWGVAALVGLVLVMVSYESSLRSMWSPVASDSV